jgi:hypothetical protein
MIVGRIVGRLAGWGFVALILGGAAQAQDSVADFYRGKQIRIRGLVARRRL